MTRGMRKRIVLLIALAACGRGADPVGEGFQSIDADQVLVATETKYTSNGVVSAEAQFDTVFMYDDSAVAKVKGVDVRLYDSTGRQSATLTADSGRTDQNTKVMVALGNVVLIVLEDGRRIQTEELHYDSQTRRIWSDVHTVQTLNGEVTEGLGGFQADDQFRNVQIIRPRGRVPGIGVQF